MRKLLAIAAIALAAGTGVLVAQNAAPAISVQNAAPVVVGTDPVAGSVGVDPATDRIKVTFSKEMMDGSWSWSTASQDTFPETNGTPRYLVDRRTCVLPVKLEPGRTYATWINSGNFGNFKDADGRSAVPYLLVFETAGGPEPAAP